MGSDAADPSLARHRARSSEGSSIQASPVSVEKRTKGPSATTRASHCCARSAMYRHSRLTLTSEAERTRDRHRGFFGLFSFIASRISHRHHQPNAPGSHAAASTRRIPLGRSDRWPPSCGSWAFIHCEIGASDFQMEIAKVTNWWLPISAKTTGAARPWLRRG